MYSGAIKNLIPTGPADLREATCECYDKILKEDDPRIIMSDNAFPKFDPDIIPPPLSARNSHTEMKKLHIYDENGNMINETGEKYLNTEEAKKMAKQNIRETSIEQEDIGMRPVSHGIVKNRKNAKKKQNNPIEGLPSDKKNVSI